MSDLMEKALAAVKRWPETQQDEAAEMLLALDRMGTLPYVASDEELAAVDEALAQTARGEYASDTDIEKAFARFRR